MTQREKDTIFFFYDAVYDFPGFLHLLFSNWGELGKQLVRAEHTEDFHTQQEKRQRTSFPSHPHTFIL